ncbi:MAG TPA: hypothetical protein VFI29_12190 [Hanamia sp.]|nr:hypothetical protein [Hanamia sp.]
MKSKFKIFLPCCFMQAGVCLLVFLMCYANDAYAQSKDSLNTSDEGIQSQSYSTEDSFHNFNDTDTLNISLDDSDKIMKWKQSRDFVYIHYLDSLLRKQKNIRSDTVSISENSGRIIRKHRTVTEVSAFNNILNSLPLKIFFWTLALIFIAFVGYKVLFKNGIFAIKKKKLITENDEELSLDLGDLSKYDSLISEAENNNNFNLAIRYLYLKTLRNLSEKGIINFVPDKTNNDYLREMKPNNYFREFRLLTRNYEYLWYGKFLINEKDYQRLKEEFIVFNKKV